MFAAYPYGACLLKRLVLPDGATVLQRGQGALQQHAVAVAGVVAVGDADAQGHEAHRALQGHGQAVPLEERPHQHAGEGIARAGM